MFVKVLAPEADDDREDGDARSRAASLLFVAPRVAWHPLDLLGELRMDAGLFDDVRDRGGLDERECFYQMLAAVNRARPGRIELAGRSQLAQRRGLHERIARNPHQGAKARAAARRALERAQSDADDVVGLFNEPAEQRGKLFVLRGEALRAVEIRVDDPDIVKRFGIDHYYEVEIVTADSQNNPIVCCVTELPADMPLGESIHENVAVTGFFLKSWAFDAQKSADSSSSPSEPKRQQLAPLVIAKTVQVLGSPQPEPQSPILAIGIVVAILIGAVVLWRVRRGDRRALGRATGAAASLPPRIEIDDAPQARDDPA
jgi:hypothetical protein